MLKKITILLIPFMFAVSHSMVANQPDPQRAFEKANKQLTQGHVRKALALYHKLAEQSRVSGALFMNMGMSYLRLDSLAKAEYYFLKAKQFEATQKRAKQGISYVKNNLSHQSAVLPTLPWQRFFNWLKTNIGVTVLLVIGLVLINIGVILYLFPWFFDRFRRSFVTAAVISAVIGVLVIFSGFYINYRTHRYHKAVMISQKAKVKQKPSAKSTIVNKAYTGYIFTVDKWKSNNHKGWTYIRMSNGQYGWIHSDEIMVL